MNLSISERRKTTFFPTLMYLSWPDFLILSIVARLRRVYSAASAFVKYSLSGMGVFYPKSGLEKIP